MNKNAPNSRTDPRGSTDEGGGAGYSIGVVIPCYRVAHKILPLLRRVGPEVAHVVVVDDACPEKSGSLVLAECDDARVKVVLHEANQGVGGAVVTGFRKALELGASVVVKLDGDGQMDPVLIGKLVSPIRTGQADFVKGNRFMLAGGLEQMPRVRLFGNACLSFLNKFVTGYWSIFDPTNGFLAMDTRLLRTLPLDRLHKRYFFESDLLYQLSMARARVVDMPMKAKYDDEKSSLRIWKVILSFPGLYALRFLHRLTVRYFLRDFSVGSVYIVGGTVLTALGLLLGIGFWIRGVMAHVPNTSGTVMLAALPLIVGTQLLIAAIQFDILQEPNSPISPFLDEE